MKTVSYTHLDVYKRQAKAERDKLNAFWYPTLQSTGAFVHMSEKIEVKQPLSQFTDPAKDFVHSIIPDDQIISAVLDKIGANTLVFPLTPRNLTTVDLSAEWVLFSGGKTICIRDRGSSSTINIFIKYSPFFITVHGSFI